MIRKSTQRGGTQFILTHRRTLIITSITVVALFLICSQIGITQLFIQRKQVDIRQNQQEELQRFPLSNENKDDANSKTVVVVENRPRVYTYHDQLNSFNEHPAILQVWKDSWRKRGWEPVVLNKTVAQQHPNFPHFDKKFRSYPTVNVKEYEMVCYYRWIAMVVVGGGFLSDYDVVNVDFPSNPHAHNEKYLNFLTVYQLHVPALVSGTKKEYERVLDLMLTYEIEPQVDHFNGNLHLSDMYLLFRLSQRNQVLALDRPVSPCHTGYLLHVSEQLTGRIKARYGDKFGASRDAKMAAASRMTREQVMATFGELL